jgi:hypothetical protein
MTDSSRSNSEAAPPTWAHTVLLRLKIQSLTLIPVPQIHLLARRASLVAARAHQGRRMQA